MADSTQALGSKDRERHAQIPSDFDPLDPDFVACPHEHLKQLRETCPVAHSQRWDGFWALTRRADIVAAAKDPSTYINSVLHIIPGGLAHHTRPLMHSDRPEHTWFRAAMLPVFNGPQGEIIAPAVRAEAERLVAELVGRDDVDLVRDYAGPLMAFTLKSFFNMDDVDPKDLNSWVHQYVEAGQRRDRESALAAHESMWATATALIEDRRKNPRDPKTDMATALVQARRPDGGELDPEKTIGALRQPYIIVWLATSHSLGNMMRRLLEDQELQQQLRKQPALIPESLEEFLRMDMPQIGFARTASQDVELHGREIKEGDGIALVFPSANRDESTFEDPDTFVIGRTPNPHLTFGAGIHSCPGKEVARDTVLAALESLINGTGSLTLSAEIEDEHWPFRAPRTLPTTVTATS